MELKLQWEGMRPKACTQTTRCWRGRRPRSRNSCLPIARGWKKSCGRNRTRSRCAATLWCCSTPSHAIMHATHAACAGLTAVRSWCSRHCSAHACHHAAHTHAAPACPPRTPVDGQVQAREHRCGAVWLPAGPGQASDAAGGDASELPSHQQDAGAGTTQSHHSLRRFWGLFDLAAGGRTFGQKYCSLTLHRAQ